MATDASTISWRTKSIERFELLPVPNEWKDSVATGSEDAWKRYYEYRSRQEEITLSYDDENEDGHNVMKSWKEAMAERVNKSIKINDCEWHWTPKFGDLRWDGINRLQSAEYYSHVWSPYAIPHAIALYHRFYEFSRAYTVAFGTIWEYQLVDFEDEQSITHDTWTELCSNRYEDEALRADVIQTSNLSKSTYKTLRRFLFGTHSTESEKVTCSKLDFWLLLFGSMGSTDDKLEEDPMTCGNFGYVWKPYSFRNKGERKKLFDLKANEDDDPNGVHPTNFEEYYPSGCSWLYHRVKEISDALGPVTMHYRAPTIKDASGYESEDELCGEDDWEDDADRYEIEDEGEGWFSYALKHARRNAKRQCLS